MRARARRHRAARLRRDRRAGALGRADGEVARGHRAHAPRRPARRRGAARSRRGGRARASPPTRSTRRARGLHRRAAPTRARSTTTASRRRVCTSVNEVICHGIPDDRAAASTATSSTSTSPSTSTACTATPTPRSASATSTPSRGAWCGSPRSACDPASRRSGPARPSPTSAGPSRPTPRTTATAWCGPSSGHGIGEQFHADAAGPALLRRRRARTIMEPGMTFTIEPMITIGSWQHRHVGRRLDRGHRRRQAHRAVRAHHPRHRRRRRRPALR